jgi:hypothetical protein
VQGYPFPIASQKTLPLKGSGIRSRWPYVYFYREFPRST